MKENDRMNYSGASRVTWFQHLCDYELFGTYHLWSLDSFVPACWITCCHNNNVDIVTTEYNKFVLFCVIITVILMGGKVCNVTTKLKVLIIINSLIRRHNWFIYTYIIWILILKHVVFNCMLIIFICRCIYIFKNRSGEMLKLICLKVRILEKKTEITPL